MSIFLISIHCSGCREFLYKYSKHGSGSLVKCYVSRIVEDNTNGDLKCPKCGEQFARFAIIHTKPAHKIIKGKVFTKGHLKK